VYADVRIVIGAMLIMPAFLVFAPTRQMIGFLPSFVLSVIALLNAGYVATMWLAYRPEYAALKSSFALIERGAFVLISRSSDEPNPPIGFAHLSIYHAQLSIYHAPVLAVHYAKAFVPSLFTIPGQYVLQTRPELKRLDDYAPVPFSVLVAISSEHALPGIPSYLACWMDEFDYLYLVGSQTPNPMPGRLTAIAAGERFTLFRIKKSLGKVNTLCK
jgi:hypothetical protein